MPGSDSVLHVTRSEFYSALLIVWLYLMLVIGDLMRVEGRWSTNVLWGGSCIMVVAYLVMTIRGKRSS